MDCRVICHVIKKCPVVASERIKLHLYINNSILSYQKILNPNKVI